MTPRPDRVRALVVLLKSGNLDGIQASTEMWDDHPLELVVVCKCCFDRAAKSRSKCSMCKSDGGGVFRVGQKPCATNREIRSALRALKEKRK